MQYQKDELRNSILLEAEREFFEKGFRGASLRRIAKRAGTTIGNLYHYFESKEALFDSIVRGEYEGFRKLLEDHSGLAAPGWEWQETGAGEWRRVLTEFIERLAPVFTRRFYILLNCSEGTGYAGAREHLVRFARDHFLEHLDEMNSDLPRELGDVIAEQLISSILYIIGNYDYEERKRILLADLILFHIIGVMGLLGD
jgi:AcrR family transcriptional regulator